MRDNISSLNITTKADEGEGTCSRLLTCSTSLCPGLFSISLDSERSNLLHARTDLEKLGAEGWKLGCAALLYPQQPDGP